MDLAIIIISVISIIVISIVVLAYFISREISKSQRLFRSIASKFDGKMKIIPFGLEFEHEQIKIRIFALQGTIQYRAEVCLRKDPRILVTRKYSKLKILDMLNYSFSREKYLFHAPVDEMYGFRAKDAEWIREIFNEDLRNGLTTIGRVTRIEIRRKIVKGALLIINHSKEEREKAEQSIVLLNQLVTQILRSSLAT